MKNKRRIIKMYKLFVSYSYTNREKNVEGVGNAIYNFENKYVSYRDIEAIEQELGINEGLGEVRVVNYKIM